jgi:S1-C subfamily serine protease
MSLKNLSQKDKEYFELDSGVIIEGLNNQRLYRYGVDEGYVLLEINNKKINDISDVDAVTLNSLSSMLFLKPNGERERIVFE